jgi:hypothetical protein
LPINQKGIQTTDRRGQTFLYNIGRTKYFSSFYSRGCVNSGTAYNLPELNSGAESGIKIVVSAPELSIFEQNIEIRVRELHFLLSFRT